MEPNLIFTSDNASTFGKLKMEICIVRALADAPTIMRAGVTVCTSGGLKISMPSRYEVVPCVTKTSASSTATSGNSVMAGTVIDISE